MNDYGFDIRDKAERYFIEFGPMTDTEAQWIEKAGSDLSLIFGLPKAIFRLVYADYVNDDADRKNAWKEIRYDSETFHKFVKMLLDSGRIPTEYIEKQLDTYGGIEEIIDKINPFNLSSFLAAYNIQYYEFAAEKDSMIEALREYHVSISSPLEKATRKFVPASFGEKERLAGLYHYLSELLGIQPKILELIFCDHQGVKSTRVTAWSSVKHSKENLDAQSAAEPIDANKVTYDKKEKCSQILFNSS